MNETDPMDETSIARRDPRRCSATNRAGAPCGKFSMRGQTVCRNHGGSSPQALAKAQAAIERADMKIRGLAIPAVDAIERLLQAESEAVNLAAAKDILDRGGLKAAHRIEVDTEITVVRPW